VFPTVFLLDDPNFSNTIVYGTTAPITLDDATHNLGRETAPLAADAAQTALQEGSLRLSPYHDQVYTDDLAPIERLIDQIVFSYLTG
jgi:hypothetical protein